VRKNERGFTLIEMLLSIAIIVMLVGLSLPVYQSFQSRNDLDIATQSIADMLRRAQSYARGVNGDTTWGVHLQSGSATLFKGASYASRATGFDETTVIASTYTVSGVSDVVFSKFSATPSTTGSITLARTTNDTRTISINGKGMVSY
jgi:prepilin-type N-terminal cleavage/methylation domain-containing protein